MSVPPKREGKGQGRISAVLAELREGAREDLATAWQREMRAAWQEQVDRVLKARVAEMLPRLQEAVQFDVGWHLAAELDAARPAIEERARAAATERLNRAVRRLLAYESEEDWAAALADAAGAFASRAAVFAVRGGTLLGLRGAAGVEAPVQDAPAFRNAMESRDTVVALRTAGELSAAILAHAGESGEARATLVPVVARDRAAAVVYAEGRVDVNAIELLAMAAGVALAARGAPSAELLAIAPAATPAAAAASQNLDPVHLRARHFARVRAAEMLLKRPAAVRTGRAANKLYAEFKEEIDSGREVYAREFKSAASVVDYFHTELVRTLAAGDMEALGKEYPGPLV